MRAFLRRDALASTAEASLQATILHLASGPTRALPSAMKVTSLRMNVQTWASISWTHVVDISD